MGFSLGYLFEASILLINAFYDLYTGQNGQYMRHWCTKWPVGI